VPTYAKYFPRVAIVSFKFLSPGYVMQYPCQLCKMESDWDVVRTRRGNCMGNAEYFALSAR